jgi:fumarate reductase subunit D
MRAPERPTSITVLSILNIIFGSLGTLLYCCGGAGILFMLSMLNSAGSDPQVQELKTMWQTLENNIPGWNAFLIGSMVAALITSVILLLSGIGLLNMKNWGRMLGLTYAVLAIIVQLGSIGYNMAVVNPAMAKLQTELQQKGGNMPGGGNPMAGNSMTNTASQIIGSVFGLALAVANLIILLQPGVIAAFYAPKRGGYPEDDYPPRDPYDDYPPQGPPGNYPPQYPPGDGGYRPPQ